MPAHRRDKKPRLLRAGHARVGVAVLLTRAQIRELQRRATVDGRSVAGYTVWLLAQDLKRSSGRRRAPVSASPRDRRLSLRIALVLPIAMRSRPRRRAAAEMRSVSGYVARLAVEAFAQR